jgi:hypothetical protein
LQSPRIHKTDMRISQPLVHGPTKWRRSPSLPFLRTAVAPATLRARGVPSLSHPGARLADHVSLVAATISATARRVTVRDSGSDTLHQSVS